MIRFVLSFFGAIFSLVTLGLFMGALTIGAVFWMYGRDLPSYEQLSRYTPKTISRVYSVEGKIIDEFARERRLYTPAEEIPEIVKQAFISAEDKNFYTHKGYDMVGIAAAFRDAVVSRGENLRGASTITQQVMKNFLLDGSRQAERKIKEIILAARVEQAMSKDEILGLYLNEIDLGVRSFGVTAAAQSYFNKPLSQLTIAEAAFLAIHPKAPYSYNPAENYNGALDRRNNLVLREMFENGYITRDEFEAAKAEPIRTVQQGDIESFRASLPPRDYFTDEIRRQLSRDFGEDEFFTGGFSVRATVDPDMQVTAAHALQRALENYDRSLGRWRGTGVSLPEASLTDPALWRAALRDAKVPRDVDIGGKWYPAVVLDVREQELLVGIEDVADDDPRGNIVPRGDTNWFRGNLFDNFKPGDVIHVSEHSAGGAFDRWTLRQVPEVQGAFMAMDVNNGRVLAMQGGFSYQHSVFNRATQAQRQPGSSFKPFVYAAALDSGYSPATIVVDAPIEINTPQGVWRPKNASDRFYGPTPLRTGIEQSRNLMTVRLAQEVGMDIVGRYAEKFGVYDNLSPVLANALGSQETTLFQMVAAYAMFANGGERVEPTLVDRVQDRFGRTVYRHDQRICTDCGNTALTRGLGPQIVTDRERVMDPVTAYQLTSMLQGVVQRGTASGTVKLSVPAAGKTGTTNDAKDVWFVGFTSNVVAGCYIGYDQPESLGDGASGGGLCGPVFQQFMSEAVTKYGGGKFRVPTQCMFIKIDRFTGARLSDSASGDNVVSECFREGEEPIFGVMFDGGFAMGGNFEVFAPGQVAQEVVTSTGRKAKVGPKASFGSLSSGGLY